jgi:hypothetical protein
MSLDRDQPVGLKAQLIDNVNLCPVARAECGNSDPAANFEWEPDLFLRGRRCSMQNIT